MKTQFEMQEERAPDPVDVALKTEWHIVRHNSGFANIQPRYTVACPGDYGSYNCDPFAGDEILICKPLDGYTVEFSIRGDWQIYRNDETLPGGCERCKIVHHSSGRPQLVHGGPPDWRWPVLEITGRIAP